MARIKRKNDAHNCTTFFLDKFALHDQYGYIKDVRQEKIEDFTLINAIASSDNEKSDMELEKTNEELAQLLRGLELRKRAYYINMSNFVFVIGGYLFDPIRKERRAPFNDWKWTIEEKKLEKIPPIPGAGRINFGAAANNGKIVVIGGNTVLNKPTDTCYVYGQNEEQWEPLPLLPNPLCGCSVSLDDTDSLYVFGGYDLLAGNLVFHNELLQLRDLTSKKWTALKSTFNKTKDYKVVSPRARALLIACGTDVIPPEGGLFACGGYNKSSTGELVPVSEILCYDKSAKHWIYLSDIPGLKKFHMFTIDDNILLISEKKSSDQGDEIVAISKYDLINKKWLMVDRQEISDSTNAIKENNS